MSSSGGAYRTQSEDTTYEAERILVEAYRRMTPAQKAQRVSEDCHALEALTIAGIKSRHPGASEAEVRVHLAELRFGRELAIAAYGPGKARQDR